jgi:hypothetical protein
VFNLSLEEVLELLEGRVSICAFLYESHLEFSLLFACLERQDFDLRCGSSFKLYLEVCLLEIVVEVKAKGLIGYRGRFCFVLGLLFKDIVEDVG